MASFGFNLVLVVSAILIFFSATGYSLSCYECTSALGEQCGNYTFVNTTHVSTQNCTMKNEVCGISVEIVGGYDSKVRRSCVSDDYCNKNKSAFLRDCRICTKNLCNSSHNIVPSFGIIAFLVVCFSWLNVNLLNIH